MKNITLKLKNIKINTIPFLIKLIISIKIIITALILSIFEFVGLILFLKIGIIYHIIKLINKLKNIINYKIKSMYNEIKNIVKNIKSLIILLLIDLVKIVKNRFNQDCYGKRLFKDIQNFVNFKLSRDIIPLIIFITSKFCIFYILYMAILEIISIQIF